jgi:hypothetical protein
MLGFFSNLLLLRLECSPEEPRVRRGTKEIKGIGRFSKINPYEKKHKAETSKDQPAQPGTVLLESNQQGRTLYAKAKKHARKGFAWGLVPVAFCYSVFFVLLGFFIHHQ